MITDIKNIINSFKNGEMIILVDDEDREKRR
jgi:3,4-dihydroxy-2-butanone 4-phosphate synthase